eukprot:5158225-Alexandrium_andersonii.AAC.1
MHDVMIVLPCLRGVALLRCTAALALPTCRLGHVGGDWPRAIGSAGGMDRLVGVWVGLVG